MMLQATYKLRKTIFFFYVKIIFYILCIDELKYYKNIK